MVEPIPQFCVTRNCCSIAVPSVITLLPAISRVIMNSDRAGMNTTWIPDLTPFKVSGQITRLKVVHEFAPRSREASIRAGFNLSSELKIGKIINGMKI